MTDYGILSDETGKKNTKKLANKINDFQVIVLYDRQPNQFDYNYLVNFPSEKLKRKISSNNIFPRIKSETFIVWRQAYEENIDLFYKLRVRARNEMLQRITEFMIAKFFSTFENYLTPLLKNKPTLKWEILKKLSNKYESILSNHTKINDEQAWEEFSKWYKNYLLQSVINEMIQVFGYEWLTTIDSEELNQLFFQKMNKNFSSNDNFMKEFTNIVNEYIEKWIYETVVKSEIHENSIEHITGILNVTGSIGESNDFESLVKSNNLIVMSNVVYQVIIEVLSNKKFTHYKDSKWPKATISSNMFNGNIQLLPIKNIEKNKVWEKTNALSELDVDILDSLCHFYLAASINIRDSVEVRLDDLLKIRGLRPKLGGNGRRGGFEKRQRQQVLKALSTIQELWIQVDNVVVYNQGKPGRKNIQGRAFHFFDLNGNPYQFNDNKVIDKFMLKIGEVFEYFLTGSGRQLKLLPNLAIEYNPYQRLLEKKLIRYLSWRWRTQARNGGYLQPHKISTLLDKLDVPIQRQPPSRIRDRFEKALDVLLDDGVITFWQYDSWDESCMAKKGWLKIWQEATIIIAPPDEIVKYYKPLERRNTLKSTGKRSLLAAPQELNDDIGEKLKEKRIKLGYTLQRVSHELEISISYLSNIERGRTTPSSNIYKRVSNWLELK